MRKLMLLSVAWSFLGCAAPLASPQCIDAWEIDVEEGEACEAAFAAEAELTAEVVSPRDPASGLPTGKRQHKPITVLF